MKNKPAYLYIALFIKPCNQSLIALSLYADCYICFYIGFSSREPLKYKTSSKLRRDGKYSCIYLHPIQAFNSQQQANEAEIALLKQCKQINCFKDLANLAIGKWFDSTGCKRSEKAIEATRQANIGRIVSAETRLKQSEARKGRPIKRRKGYKCKRTKETNEKIRASMIGQKYDSIRCNNISKSLKDKKHSDQHKKANSDAQKIAHTKALQAKLNWPVCLTNDIIYKELKNAEELICFIEENKLTRKVLIKVILGEKKSFKQWRLI